MKKRLAILLFLSGCASVPSAQLRVDNADNLADQKGWQAQRIQTRTFDLISYVPAQINQNTSLTIYIEGDGFAWRTRTTPSSNPTPNNPKGLMLALEHGENNIAYLARPCQFVGDYSRGCHEDYWINKRFSEEVIVASNEAVSNLKKQFGASQIQLVGYSGGGAIAALLTARRTDVVRLITVAGNLDHKAWASLHKITPLTGSLNPADYRERIHHVEQVHFVGEKDQVIPKSLTRNFVTYFSTNKNVRVIEVPDQTHHCCWEAKWPTLIQALELE